MRLCLTDDAACVLSAVYGAVVFAAVYIAVLPAADTADVVADVRISHIAAVGALDDISRGIARNSACIGGIVGLLGGVDIVNVYVLDVKSAVGHIGVYRCRVFGKHNAATVLACNSASEMLRLNASANLAAGDKSRFLVNSCYSAAVFLARNNTVNGAAVYSSPVHTAYSAAFGRCARWGYLAGNAYIFDPAAFSMYLKSP